MPVEFVGDPTQDALIPVVAPKMGVAVGRLDLDHHRLLQQADVEGTTAQVEDQDGFIFLLVQAVGQRSRSGLVMMRMTSRPAIFPASLVAWRCESLK